ncbi:unnamed protein product [Rhizophagus irregularis]|nr:unnamed protein product [Rhizophagus irregularis]
MSNETEILIIILIIIILIKYNELEESLNTSYQIEQEEENSNILPISLLHLQQLNRIEINEHINLRKLNRTISQYLFNEILREITGSNMVGPT